MTEVPSKLVPLRTKCHPFENQLDNPLGFTEMVTFLA